jgi:hypothetical protein
MGYFNDVPTETDTEWNSILLSVRDPKSDLNCAKCDSYRVEVPLDIIKTVTREHTRAENKSSSGSEQWAVVLSDDTTLKGEPTTFEDFKARATSAIFRFPEAGFRRSYSLRLRGATKLKQTAVTRSRFILPTLKSAG